MDNSLQGMKSYVGEYISDLKRKGICVPVTVTQYCKTVRTNISGTKPTVLSVVVHLILNLCRILLYNQEAIGFKKLLNT